MSRDRNPGAAADRQAPTTRDRARAALTLRTFREYRGLTQKGLAELSGVHNATISSYERGRRSLDFFTQAKRGAADPVTDADLDLFAETVGRDIEQASLDLLRLVRAPSRDDRDR